jgi:peroxiredoxin
MVGVGERLPEGRVLVKGEGGLEWVDTRDLFAGRRVVLFGLPGAYTGLCTTAHVPSFLRTKARFDAAGVDAILCLAANDPFVLEAWGRDTGAAEAGIGMLADPAGEWIEALGTLFDLPERGFLRRSRRFAAYVEDGVVRVWHEEESPGACEATAGEAMLAAVEKATA